MQNSRSRSHKWLRGWTLVSALAIAAAAVRPVSAEDTQKRIEKAVETLNKLTDSTEHGIPAQKFAKADCVAVIPAFKKGAAVVGVSFGRGFIACRNGGNWSAPAAVTLEGGSLGVQVGGEKIDIVILSLDPERRCKLLSDRFSIGADTSAAWGNGKAAHEDPNAQILFFGHTSGAFAGFDLDGTTLKPDDSGNQALYGKRGPNSEIIQGATIPAIAQSLTTKLTSLARSDAASEANTTH